MKRCPSCGEENADRARFCQRCATPLEEAAPPPGDVRKVVTIVFADVTGSTALGERLDPEALRRVMGRYFDEMAAAIERHGGTVEKFIGDAVMAVFGIPRLHEDDAVRAVRAAIGMREALEALNLDLEREHGEGLAARIGVNTGEVVAGDPSAGQRLVTGDAVNVAARLEQAAAPGEILLGDPTYRLVKDAVEVEPVDALALKGKQQPVPAFRLIAVAADTAGHERHLDSPMVGRAKELSLLEHALERAVTDRTSHLFTLMGPAGVGKSRLVAEFLGGSVSEATVLRGRCLSYGEGITFFPLADVVHQAAGILDSDLPAVARSKLDDVLGDAPDRDRVAGLVAGLFGWADPGATEDAFWAVRKLLEHLARDRPLVVVFDDIHWGEPTFLDLIEHLADWTRDAAVLLLCIARPELLEVRPGWGGGKMNATSILLEPLAGDDASQLVDNLLGRADIPQVARDRILEAAEGNPLFVEEMLAMLIDDGLLRFEDGAWRSVEDLANVTVPPTIHLLLAARLDRLDADERAVIERGSVEGKVFHSGAVATLSQETARPNVRSRLLALARKELIRPDRPEFAGEDAFRFRHLLIRDAAYQAMPKEQRADLHERFAGWLAEAARERMAEYEEILGYHLEQAYRYREELGAADEAARGIATRAAEYLFASAVRADERNDLNAAKAFLERSVALSDGGLQGRSLLLLAEVVQELGEYTAAHEIVLRARDVADAVGDRALFLRAELVRIITQGSVDSSQTIAKGPRGGGGRPRGGGSSGRRGAARPSDLHPRGAVLLPRSHEGRGRDARRPDRAGFDDVSEVAPLHGDAAQRVRLLRRHPGGRGVRDDRARASTRRRQPQRRGVDPPGHGRAPRDGGEVRGGARGDATRGRAVRGAGHADGRHRHEPGAGGDAPARGASGGGGSAAPRDDRGLRCDRRDRLQLDDRRRCSRTRSATRAATRRRSGWLRGAGSSRPMTISPRRHPGGWRRLGCWPIAAPSRMPSASRTRPSRSTGRPTTSAGKGMGSK